MSSKSAIKNKKRQVKRAANSQPMKSQIDIAKEAVEEVTVKLAQAKRDKDHKLCSKLREQLWVLTDMVNGVKTDLPEKQLEEIMESIDFTELEKVPSELVVKSIPTENRKLLNLRKKYTKILELEKKLEEGIKLEKNQIVKLETKNQIAEEIRELEILHHNLMAQ